ncbi:hypothetical protein [Streptomyces sp. ISL-99]|nr:hypothetical protein [Streptomyces sp. ISL-99]
MVQPHTERLAGWLGWCPQPLETAGDTQDPGFMAQQLGAGSR